MKTKRIDRGTIKDVPNTFMSTEEEKKAIQDKADEMGITMSALCRMVLKDFLKKTNNKKQKERMR